MQKRVVIYWNDIKPREYNGFPDLKIFINGKIFTFVSTDHVARPDS